MLYEDIFNARQAEARVASRSIDQRIAWDQIRQVERLETALRAAKVRLPWNNPGMTAKAN